MVDRRNPIIEAEMDEWEALGGTNLGIYGATDGSHPTGFHRSGNEVPPTDYSRKYDPGLPYNMYWPCAGDFGHRGRADLKAMQGAVLNGLNTGDPRFSMIDEFIGQPFPGHPVLYWCRWNPGIRAYTGSGHGGGPGGWSHISWRRSTAYKRAYLWRSQAVGYGGSEVELTDNLPGGQLSVGQALLDTWGALQAERDTAVEKRNDLDRFQRRNTAYVIRDMVRAELAPITAALAAIAEHVDIDPEELEAIKTAAHEGAKTGAEAGADALVAAVIANLPEGDLTVEQVEQAVRDAFSGGLAPEAV